MKLRNRIIEAIMLALPLLLAVVCLASVTLGRQQASLPIPMPQEFIGEYSYDGENWQALTGDADISALDGDLFLRGSFLREMKAGWHLNFYRNHIGVSVKVNGEEKIDELIANGFSPKVMANIKDDGFSLETLAAIHALPSSYLQYYYCRNAKLEYLLKGEKSRAQKCMEIEEELLEMYSDEGLYVKPALLDQRGGHKYSLVAVSLINALANDIGDVQVVNIKNGNTLPFLKPDDVIEVPARIGKNGAEPIDLGEITNRHIIGLMSIVKEYERYTVEAAKTGSSEAALNALLVHPLVGDWEKAVNCFNEMKEAHKDYLPQFFNN